MTRQSRRGLRTAGATVLLAAALLGGCASLPAARMQLPEAFAGRVPETVAGDLAGRQGAATLGAITARFDRGADRLSIFGPLLEFDRATLAYRSDDAAGGSTQLRCRGRETLAQAGVIALAPRPYTLRCDWDGAFGARLELDAVAAAGGTQAARRGRLRHAGGEIEIESVHRVAGSPLPLEAPIGYLLRQQGRVVGAVELNGRPQVWRPAADDPTHAALGHLALALALTWDPATR